MSLNQLLLIAVFIALLPTALLSFYLSFAGRNQARELIGERLEASASATASMQRQSIAQVIRNMRLLAAKPEVRDIGPKCDAVLAAEMGVVPSASNYARTDADGRVRCSALPRREGLSVADQRWWREGRDSGRVTFSETQFGEMSQRRIIVAMLPMRDAARRFDGAINAGIDATWIAQSLESRTNEDTGVVALIDGEGRLLLANDDYKLGLMPNLEGNQTRAVKDNEGREWLYSSAAVWEDQLHILYAEPLTPLVAPLTDQLRLTIALPIATIILTCLAIWLAMQLFAARWIGRLHDLIAQLGRGDYAVDLGLFRSAPSDIARLAEDMHRMARSIEQRDSQLRASADARLALVGEVNHRVKNNLQMIMSLISLQSAKVTEPVAKAALDQMRMRISALALIYRSLYEDEGESEQGKVDVDRLMTTLAEQLRLSSPTVDVNIAVTSNVGVRAVDEVIPLAMFVVEVLTNALRHAYPDLRGGTIRLGIAVEDAVTILTVEDDGVGYPVDTVANEFGGTLITAYARQLGGTLDIASDEKSGTRVTLRYTARGGGDRKIKQAGKNRE